MFQLRLICLLSCALIATTNATTYAAAQDATSPPAGQSVLLILTGDGVQIYACKQTGGETNGAWTFVAPEAKLLDAGGAELGSHGAGPMWSLKDGSSVHGKVIAQQPSAGTIPWLLLQAVDAKGPGALASVTYIRRSETRGGIAHTVPCDTAHTGITDRVPYTATYTFYGISK